MIYSKPIREISYQDVVDFCNSGHEEGFILEYKKDFPPNNEIIAKTIAAFANTYGGLLIIGIYAPAGHPVPPFEGITFDPTQKYEEKIQSIILSHIKEPVFPEVRICEPVKGKTFVIIRVSESHLTPHRVSNNRKIYVRTGQSSTPNDEATYDQQEWLVGRRKKSEEFRHFLIEEAETYLRDACALSGINVRDKSQYFGVITIGAIPLFPQKPLVPYKEMKGLENVITARGNYSQFPEYFCDPDTIQNGIRKLWVDCKDGESAHGKPFEYTHLNTFGLYLWKRDVGEVATQKTKNADGTETENQLQRIKFWYFPIRLYQFLHSLIRFYQKLGYYGTVQIWVELKGALGAEIPNTSRKDWNRTDEFLKIPSNNLRWERVVEVSKIQEAMQGVVVDLAEEIGWSFNVGNLTEQRIKDSLKDYHPRS